MNSICSPVHRRAHFDFVRIKRFGRTLCTIGRRPNARFVCALLILSVCLPLQWVNAQSGIASERNVKVAYIYNFLRYVRWPEQSFVDRSSPIVIGVMAGDPHGRLLSKVAGKKKALGRTIVVRRFHSVTELQECHLVFLSSGTTPADEAEAIAITERQQTLLICDSSVAPQPGAPIRFFADHDGTIGLRINIDAMGRRGLQPDAKLLNIATVVRD